MIFEQNLLFSERILDITHFQEKTGHYHIWSLYDTKNPGHYRIWSLKKLDISKFWQKSWTYGLPNYQPIYSYFPIGLTAIALALQLVVIYTFATQYARRYVYQGFWLTHNTYPVWYILMMLHGMGRLVQDPLFGNFIIGPALIYIFDKLISYSRRKIELAVVKAHVLPSLVTGIYLKKPPGLEYQ